MLRIDPVKDLVDPRPRIQSKQCIYTKVYRTSQGSAKMAAINSISGIDLPKLELLPRRFSNAVRAVALVTRRTDTATGFPASRQLRHDRAPAMSPSLSHQETPAWHTRFAPLRCRACRACGGCDAQLGFHAGGLRHANRRIKVVVRSLPLGLQCTVTRSLVQKRPPWL